MLTALKVKSMLLGLAVGDALGVPVEFTKRESLKRNPVVGMRSAGAWRQPAGTWSDDTSLAVAAMDSIINQKKIDYSDIMRNFSRWLYRDEFNANDVTFDCGNTTGSAISNFVGGATPENCGMTDKHSNGNGSLMRILPAVVYAYAKASTEDEALDIVHKISALTHAHPISLVGCGIYYFIAAQIFDGKNLNDAINDGLKQAQEFYIRREKFMDALKVYHRLFDKNFAALPEDEIESYGYVVVTLEAAIWCLMNTENYKDSVLKAVNLGSDTDTVGAITGCISGLYYGLKEIPEDWLQTLKKRDYLENLAEKFFFAING